MTAADIVWAPLLERYAVQLPCFHAALNPRDPIRWPKLEKWYQAMETVPVYACRIRGDAPSWRKVLYREPWWPAADLWHPRETVGPKGELLLDEDDCIAVYGNVAVPQSVWNSYAADRPYVGSTPSIEAAIQLIRNRKAIRADAEKWMKDQGYHDNLNTLDSNLAAIVCALLVDGEGRRSLEIDQKMLRREMLLYLDDRVCVPRDMGAPVAHCIRKLRLQIESEQSHWLGARN